MRISQSMHTQAYLVLFDFPGKILTTGAKFVIMRRKMEKIHFF